jgi:N-carbamoylputrescine amidase
MTQPRAPREPFTIGLVQEAATEDVASNVARHVARIREAHARGAQIVCMQELFNAPYFAKSLRVDRFDLAEPVPGPTTSTMQQLASELGVVIIVPLYERQAAGLYRNSAVVIDADGSILGTYRKMHIPHDPLFEEKYYFAPGDANGAQASGVEASHSSGGFHVWKTRFADIGVLICWDQWYPEGARITSLLGAEVLFYPTAIGWHPAEKAQYGAAQLDAWRTIQRGHAIANGVYVAAPNRVGFEPEAGTGGLEFFGHSFVSDPFGRVIAEAGETPDVVIARCEPAIIEETRRHWPFLRDRRVDAYGGILSRYLV